MKQKEILLQDVLQHLKIEIPSNFGQKREIVSTCPFKENHQNGDQKPSCSFNFEKNLFHCFACGESGNSITLLKKKNSLEDFLLEHGLTPKKESKKTKPYKSESDSKNPPRNAKKEQKAIEILHWESEIFESEETQIQIQNLIFEKLSYLVEKNPNFESFSIFENKTPSGKTFSADIRLDFGKKEKKFFHLSFVQKAQKLNLVFKSPQKPYPFFGIETFPHSKTIIFVEGQKCAVSLQKALQKAQISEIAVLSFDGANSKLENYDFSVFERFSSFDPDTLKFFLIPDNDSAGLAGARRLAEKLVSISPDVSVCEPLGKTKGYDISDLLEEIEENEFETFDLARLNQILSQKICIFSNEFLNEILRKRKIKESLKKEKEEKPLETKLISKKILVDDKFIDTKFAFPEILPFKSESGKVSFGSNNLKFLQDQYGFVLQNDSITLAEKISCKNPSLLVKTNGIRSSSGSSNFKDIEKLNSFKMIARAHGFKPTDLKEALDEIFSTETTNSVLEFLSHKAWDGKERFEKYIDDVFDFEKLPIDDEVFRSQNEIFEFQKKLIRKWFFSSLRVLFQEPGEGDICEQLAQVKGVLVLVGPQSCGKTRFFESLFPSRGEFSQFDTSTFWKSGQSIDTSSKDNIKSNISKWIVELGELDATFKREDIAKLKQFLSNSSDEIRLPYAVSEKVFPRKTLFGASVNSFEFLKDKTGNVRFWPIALKRIRIEKIPKGEELFQIWAEIFFKFKKNVSLWKNEKMTDEELVSTWSVFKEDQRRLDFFNSTNFSSTEVWEEFIDELLAPIPETKEEFDSMDMKSHEFELKKIRRIDLIKIFETELGVKISEKKLSEVLRTKGLVTQKLDRKTRIYCYKNFSNSGKDYFGFFINKNVLK